MDSVVTADPDIENPEASQVVSEAFSELYVLEHDGQIRRAFLLLGDAALAHDVVADAFVAVYQRWHTIDEPGPYLNRCVLNGCRNSRQRRSREQLVEDIQPDPGDLEPVDEMAEVLLGDFATYSYRRTAMSDSPVDPAEVALTELLELRASQVTVHDDVDAVLLAAAPMSSAMGAAEALRTRWLLAAAALLVVASGASLLTGTVNRTEATINSSSRVTPV